MKKREKVEELEKYFNGFKGKIFIFFNTLLFVYTFKRKHFSGYSVREYGRTPPQEVYESIANFIE